MEKVKCKPSALNRSLLKGRKCNTMYTKMTQHSPPLSVSQLTFAIKKHLEHQFGLVQVQGEISNLKFQSSGHIYFSLKDREAQISAALFRSQAQQLPGSLKNGDQVVVTAELSVYPPRGNYQLIVRQVQPVGLGELLVKLEQLKQEIHRRGWFAKKHKQPLPSFPRSLGIITSPTGAAIRDILKVLQRRFPSLSIFVYPVRVQGDLAAAEIAQGIREMDALQLDVLLVGRGGGSMEDLWAFNEEPVAEAIFHAKTPLIAAVGHETDHCIAEYVADLRAPTPSAAAELVVPNRDDLIQKLDHIHSRLQHHLRKEFQQWTSRMQSLLRHPSLRSPQSMIAPWMQRSDELKESLDFHVQQRLRFLRERLNFQQKQLYTLNPSAQLLRHRHRLEGLSRQLHYALLPRIAAKKEALQRIRQSLEAIDPKNLLKKGYSIIFAEKEQSIISSTSQTTKGAALSILVSDGRVRATVEQVEPL